MTHFLNEIFAIGILVIFSIGLSCLIILLSYSVSSSTPDTEKVSAYECGFDPYADARNLFDVRFYLVAILFIIFDLEAVYFFPWCTTFSLLSLEGFWYMIDFLFELVVGFFYAWKTRALDWE